MHSTSTDTPDIASASAQADYVRFMEQVRVSCGAANNPRRDNISKLKRGLRSVTSDGGSQAGITQAIEAVGKGINKKWTQEKVKLAIGVAGLYATYGMKDASKSQDWASIGSVLRVAPRRGEGKVGYGPELSRVAASSDIRTALHRTSRACSLSNGKSSILDWPRLLQDLAILTSEDYDRKEAVSMRWARDFAGLKSEEAQPEDAGPHDHEG